MQRSPIKKQTTTGAKEVKASSEPGITNYNKTNLLKKKHIIFAQTPYLKQLLFHALTLGTSVNDIIFGLPEDVPSGPQTDSEQPHRGTPPARATTTLKPQMMTTSTPTSSLPRMSHKK